MSIAKNIVQNGVWGVCYDEFGSASSSPLFTVLLSTLFYFFGVNIYISIFINIFFSILIIYFAWNFFKNKINIFLLSILLLTIIIITPLPNMTIIAMEHVMHAFFTLLYILILWRIVVYKERSNKIAYLYLVICFLLPISRYEGLFIIIGGSIVLLCLKNFKLSILGGLIALFSISIFGFYFISKGGTFLPYSLILKTSLVSENGGLISKILPYNLIKLNYFSNKSYRSLLLSFIIILIYTLIIQKGKNRIYSIIVTLFIALFLQVLYSKFGWLDRYEAYIIPSILCILFYSIYYLYINLKQVMAFENILYLGCFIVLLYPSYYLSKRTYNNTKNLLLACNDIYNQQYQTALFISEFYPYANIGVNDVGYPSLISKGHVVDLVGLGNTNIALAKKNQKDVIKVSNEELENNNVKVIFIYKSWFSPNFYSKYKEIGSWKLKYNPVALGDNEVAIFSVSNDLIDIEYLKTSLKEYSYKLPKSVEYIKK
ncbi:hypothetical protein ETU10_09910 [Apibacter muscae]|uniref:hypothetical protein n=1 Tax=Apibacter muscae TaxID=2509004 RepID=UPI0011AD1D31|nr:hypothetical protein [Apibacter muscae]TWP22898.1 hypothetical protein ETU10_09910 [Apibacter muscae]